MRNFAIRTACDNQPQDLQLAFTQRLSERLTPLLFFNDLFMDVWRDVFPVSENEPAC
jgi:hypothetical protein